MVVGRESGESAVSGGVDCPLQPPQGEPLIAELHQRQMYAEIHPRIVPVRSRQFQVAAGSGSLWTRRTLLLAREAMAAAAAGELS